VRDEHADFDGGRTFVEQQPNALASRQLPLFVLPIDPLLSTTCP